MTRHIVTRRALLRRAIGGAAVTAATVQVRGAHAAGRLSVGFWDHWMPGANEALRAICAEWATKEKVDLNVDFISSEGNRNLLAIAAAAQRQTIHDITAFPAWQAAQHWRQLEPVDDIMKVLIAANGALDPTLLPFTRTTGRWFAVPAATGIRITCPCTRIDLLKKFAGIDVQALYPSGAPPRADEWTWTSFLGAAEACFKSGRPFGLALGVTSTAVDWVSALFESHGAQLVDANGEITADSDAVKQVLNYAKRLARWLPQDVFSWSDTTGPRWLIEGRSALTMAAPTAWFAARRDAPEVAQACWMHGMPAGPMGRVVPMQPQVWGIWNFSRNKAAAKSLLAALWQPGSLARLAAAGRGFDLAAFERQSGTLESADAEPLADALYHYPDLRRHQVRWIAGAPGPPRIASQISTQATMTRMIARVTTLGESIGASVAWAQHELQAFKRN